MQKKIIKRWLQNNFHLFWNKLILKTFVVWSVQFLASPSFIVFFTLLFTLTGSEKSWVCVFNDAPLAELFDCSVAFYGDGTILDVELLKTPAVIRNTLDPLVCHHLAAFHAELFQIGAKFRQRFQALIGDVTFTDVKRSQPGAVLGHELNGRIADSLAASNI